jgi:uncharacterized membrane protein (DUF373 family)
VGAEQIMALQVWISRAESAVYLIVGMMLVVAAGFTVVGTVVDLIEGSDSRRITDTGVFLLDRVLVLFIIAELLYTLRAVNFGGRIWVEPFLFIALIAVVRKVLVIAAEAEQDDLHGVDFVIEIGGLAGLALVLALAIYLLRRSTPAAVEPEPRLE